MIPVAEYECLAGRVKYVDGYLIWTDCCKKSLNGTIVGKVNKQGYARIHHKEHGMIGVHRLIYFLHFGTLPLVVDHIDGNPRNNDINNLRAATIAENARNSKTPNCNTSGRKGVYWSKSTSKWQASIRVGKKLRYLGVYKNFNDAVKAREKAEKEHHGEFARH